MRAALQIALALAVLAMPVAAQDSVSKNLGGLPGDALSPWDTAQQCAEYVVDLTPFTASWGTQFGIAPLVKASKSSTSAATKEYFNSQISAQGISRIQALGVPYPAASYDLWVNTPGQGTHPTMNNAPGTVSPTGTGNQFGVAFADFGTTDASQNYSGVLGAVVNYDPAQPTRLYVKRVQAATNGNSASDNLLQYGVGAVDEWGNVMFRGDTGVTGSANQMFNVDMLARNCGARNVATATGGSDAAATNWIVRNSTVIHNTPGIGPKSIFGVPYFIGTNFNKEYTYGAANPPATTTAHRPGTTDHRGGIAYMTRNVPCVAGTHGTAAIISKSTAGNGPTDSISVWGLNADASVAGTLLLTLPAAPIADPTNPSMLSYTGAVFDHYHSQVAYSGGNAPIALGVDQQGRLLAAGVLYDVVTYAGYDNPWNDIVVARVTCGTPNTIQWSLVAYSSDATMVGGTGKPILDGPGGTPIGRLTTMFDVTGGAPLGPSLSAPLIDSVGNIWFVSAMIWYGPDGLPNTADDDKDSALIRAVYNPATLGYELELVAELGMAFPGQNSGRWWTINFMGVADSNSVSSGTAWSGNISETGHLGVLPAADVPTRDATTLGGLVLNVSMIYDANNDLEYNDPTSQYYDPSIPADEAYSALLYIGATVPAAPQVCIGDLNCDGQVSFGDINPFVLYLSNYAAWQTTYAGCEPQNGDINADGNYPSFGDINAFVTLLSTSSLPIICP